jgi:hypothetical protein
MIEMSNAVQPQVVYVKHQRSKMLAFLLALFFGPLGMLYSTVIGALVMLVLFSVLGTLTAGVALIVLWPICVIWAVLAA